MPKSRGYSNDVTDTAKCFLLNNDKHKPNVDHKSANEIKEYFFANEKSVMGGCYGHYPTKDIVWKEIEEAAALDKGYPLKHDWMEYEVENLMKKLKINLKWDFDKTTKSFHSKYKDFILQKQVFCDNGNLLTFRYIIRKKGKIVTGCEISNIFNGGTKATSIIEKKDDVLMNYYLLFALGKYTQKEIVLFDLKGNKIIEKKDIHLLLPTGKKNAYVFEINKDSTVKICLEDTKLHFSERFLDVDPKSIIILDEKTF